MNEISPLWYHVRADGSLDKEVNSKALAVAHQNGIKVVPLVNLVPSQDAILRDTAAENRAISNLAQEVKTNNYNGIDIDFEFIPNSTTKDFSVDRDRLTVFIKKLYTSMSNLKKETQMAVLPLVGVPKEMAGVDDYGALAPLPTKVTLMTYDHSQASSPPGTGGALFLGGAEHHHGDPTGVQARANTAWGLPPTVMTGRKERQAAFPGQPRRS